MPFTIRCARYGCGNQFQVSTLRDLDQAPRVWVCPICADFDQQDDINHMERQMTTPVREQATHEPQ